MKKFSLSKLRTRHLTRLSVVGLGVFLIIVVIIWWLSGQQSDQIIIERIETQELGMARGGALVFSEFFKAMKKELILLSEMEAIKAGKEDKGLEVLEIVAKELRKEDAPVGNIIRVDKEGLTLWGTNVKLGRQDEASKGVYIGDRDCFQWAKEEGKEGEVLISGPTTAPGGSLRGKRIVSLNTPVFNQGEFDGILVVSFPVDDLAKKYIEPLSLSPKVYWTVLNEEGMVITSTFTELSGKNIFELQKEENWPEASRHIVKKATQGEEGASYHSYINFFTKEISEAVSAYAPIRINSSTWSLWVSVPYGEIQKLVLPFRQKQIFVLVVVSVGSLILIIIYILGIRVSQKDSFLDGYARAKDHLSKRKKS